MRQILASVLFASICLLGAAPARTAAALTMEEILAASKPSDWRLVDPENTLYVELAAGRVVIELAPEFAPRHVANIKTLARARYYDGLPINRVQDNFVAQWNDPGGRRPLGAAKPALPAEFTIPAAGVQFTTLPDGDLYAPQTGFVAGLPAARNRPDGLAWLAHCYGMVGVARDDAADSGNGARLYVVIGHAPRQLDRNVTLVGRVLQGMELLSAQPRGSAPRGYHASDEQSTLIRAVRVAADAPASERTPLEALRTDAPIFTALIESRRNRPDEWFKFRAGRIELCNVPIPVRPARQERTSTGSAGNSGVREAG